MPLDCACLFSSFVPGEERLRAERVDTAAPGCTCENVQLDARSPGRVGEGEVLARLIVAPKDLVEDGSRLKSDTLSSAESMGLSVLRDAFASDQEVLATAREIVARAAERSGKPAYVHGIVLAPCELYRRRGWLPGVGQLYCVYDTPNATTRAHSDVLAALRSFPTRNSHQRARKNLLDVLEPLVVQVETYRRGLLVPLARPA